MERGKDVSESPLVPLIKGGDGWFHLVVKSIRYRQSASLSPSQRACPEPAEVENERDSLSARGGNK
jgi:hypothetical protein